MCFFSPPRSYHKIFHHMHPSNFTRPLYTAQISTTISAFKV